MSWLIVAAFVGFVASMPFEATLFGDSFSVSRLLGYTFFGLALLQPRLCFRKPPAAFWWFALYLALFVLTGLYQPSVYWIENRSTLFRMIQFLMLLWVGYSLFQFERVAKWCLWGFGLASAAAASFLVAGLGVSNYAGLAARQTVFGQGPNTIGSIIGLGAVVLIGLAYGRAGSSSWTKLAAWAGLLVVAAAITRTGSRGALVGLGMGVMTLLAARGSARTRMRNALIVVLALGACIWITVAYATSASRWQQTLEEGRMSGRPRIYRAAFRMFEEKPILGWGPATNYYELGRRLNRPKRDTHNMFLWLLTEQGLVGTIPFCIGLALAVRAAWRGRRGTQGQLPLALLAASLTLNLSGTYFNVAKWFWVILAYALASETYVGRRRSRSKVVTAKAPGARLTAAPLRVARVGVSPARVLWNRPPASH